MESLESYLAVSDAQNKVTSSLGHGHSARSIIHSLIITQNISQQELEQISKDQGIATYDEGDSNSALRPEEDIIRVGYTDFRDS